MKKQIYFFTTPSGTLVSEIAGSAMFAKLKLLTVLHADHSDYLKLAPTPLETGRDAFEIHGWLER